MISSTPTKPAYFEFLLKPSMLEEHLSQSDPGWCLVVIVILVIVISL